MTPVIVFVAIALAIALAIVLVSRAARSRDGVDSFRRQIDALSPEARRPTIDQVHRAGSANDDEADGADEAEDTGGSVADGADPEDGAHGA